MIELIKKNKIYHMASMARSGETLMLKILAVHPDVRVIHNLDKEDDLHSVKAFEFIKNFEPKQISRRHKLMQPYHLKRNQIILIKQGVWKHQYPFDGFILSRNPVSIYSSLKAYDKKAEGYDEATNFWFGNVERFKRWLNGIQPEIIEELIAKSPIEQFVDFYNLRMGELLNTDIPIVKYEDLIVNTEDTLRKVCSYIGIQMDDSLLNSHKFYKNGLEGHGQNDLSKPIDASSLHKYKLNVTEEEFNFIKENTLNVHKGYGYELHQGEVNY
ncbi:sulfotransferase domain-containing protein [Mangrovimonas xylaniphaga]|uniref:sulfotransferase domain-containing protein n=1 Tax=Mangrovimonas xylaniphaga TaxID=1645915 RepID=UPI0012F84A96|nr:sulfotransferase domain-containing protein [Mangrovimonas xylaniphaga]